jgi:hypothetical protein
VPRTATDWERIDTQAWDAIRNCALRAGFDPIRDGLDYAELTRWFLWDKVARAVRARVDPAAFEFEAESIGWRSPARVQVAGDAAGIVARLGLRARMAARAAFSGVRSRRAPRNTSANKILFLPAPSPRLIGAAASFAHHPLVDVATPDSKTEIAHARRVPYPKGIVAPDASFADELCRAIVHGLERADVRLFEPDAAKLGEEILLLLRQVGAARGYLAAVRPDALLVHADNHPPHQVYVLAAQREGIPCVMLQHGLDCERLYLDEAYADAIAVWGEQRAARYRKESTHRPARIDVTGNPEFDDRQLPESLDTGTGDWLWVTRPHSSAKCYSPSRSPREGMAIFEALMDALAVTPGPALIVKPHPYDNIPLYEDRVKSHPAGGRVQIVDTPPKMLFARAGVVITEDTTAGMEAMFEGKRVVHAHFAPTPPTVDYVGYDAALPGFSAPQLADSLRHAAMLVSAEASAMLDGQRRFLLAHAGPCDGRAGERVRDFILNVMGLS